MTLENEITQEVGEAVTEAPIVEESVVDEVAVEEATIDETIVVEEEVAQEPTVRELMERLDSQAVEIQKANNRTSYLQRKYDRSKVQGSKPAALKPDSDSFDTNEEFIEALTEWKVDERDRTAAVTRVTEDSAQSMADFVAVIDTGVEKYSDFNEVARKPYESGGPRITPSMLEAMMESDNPIDIGYFLGQNVAESVRISNMTPIGAAREIGKIEAMFSNGGKVTPKTPQKTTQKTITPSSPVVGKTIPEGSLGDMETDDFMRSRNKRDGVG